MTSPVRASKKACPDAQRPQGKCRCGATVAAKQRASDLEQLTRLIEAGTLTPVIDRTYTQEQVPDAMRYFDDGKTRGKIAIIIQAPQA